ncbi:zinc-dependent metalloprotease [Maribacter sp. 2308TA10-17]|uniref:zinc-dependent metalloprotease n=1 Tax=Maribacter sp. 2308TA10-17 TaxID=3386276 RepID=UPI0039BD8476
MRLFVLLVGLILLNASCSTMGIFGNKNSIAVSGEQSVNKAKGYDRIITKDAISQKGLFDVHRVGEKYYFEIPDSLFNREILVVTRFIKTPSGAGNYGGEKISENTIVFEKGPTNNIFLRIATLVSAADENDAISKAVNNSNITPILEAFDIKASHEKKGTHLIEVTAFLNSENPLLALSNPQKDSYKLIGIEKDKSYIKEINSFPINTEIKTVKTYKAKSVKGKRKKALPAAVHAGVVTLEINNSFILLPKEPMQKRYADARVGYFASSYLEYGDDQQKVDRNTYIHRWRLEPRPEDIEKWKQGELVEPQKPIIYYIDPATPKKWRPYLIQGINDWQVAFEQAGFKNAIVGMEWPENDPTMSLEDARFSVLRYFASPSKNAYGPNIVDPRSGEILESHIGWYHNLMNLLHSWYMVQAGAVDPRAQQMEFETELMGDLIRFVSSHEVGHTLGLRHNMGASSATPVANLRDAEWLKENGHTSSIMDYARFNYVAQPEDNIPVEDLMPRIGDYDKWAIQWGYSKLNEDFTRNEERELLSQMIVDSVSNNRRLWFGGEGRDFDPRSQTEDLGDNAMEASMYGILNLQRIAPCIKEWVKESDSDDFSNLDQIYKDLVNQYSDYIFHVTKNIGGIYVTPKTMGEEGEVYRPVDIQTQKQALVFLNNYIFQEPKWLMRNDILNAIQSPRSKESVTKTMESVMMNLLGGSRLSRMTFISERYEDENPYRPEDYIDDLNQLVWGDMNVFYQTNAYKRKLQKSYVSNMIALYKPDVTEGFVEGLLAELSKGFTSNTDVRSLALDNLLTLQGKIKRTIPVMTDRLTIAHLNYLKREIEAVVGETDDVDPLFIPFRKDISIKEDGKE